MTDRPVAARIACFTLPVQGHMTPLLPVLRELADRGAQIHALAAEEYREALEAVGAAVAPYPAEIAAEAERPSNNLFEVAALLGAFTEDRLLDLSLRHLEATQPDVVIVDSMAPWGRLAALKLGIPAITSTSSFIVSAQLGATPSATLDLVLRAGSATGALRSIVRTRRALKRSYGVDHGGPLTLLSNRADATLAYTSRMLQPGGDRFGPEVHFVGPTAAERDSPPLSAGDPLVAALHAADDGRPLAYVSLGTIYNERPKFLRAATEALVEAGMGVVLALGRRVHPSALGTLPPEAVAVHAPPQLRILDRARLFVTHGGMNSVHEALWRAVPMVVFPQAADQPIVGARVEELGAGVVLPGREPGHREIGFAVRSVLASGAAAKAEILGRSLQSAGGAPAAADAVLALARR